MPNPPWHSVHLHTYNAMLCSRIQSILFRYSENRTQINNWWNTIFFVGMGLTWNRLFNKWPVTHPSCSLTFNIHRIQWTLTAPIVTENQPYMCSKTNIPTVINSVTISNAHASTCPLPVTMLLFLSIQHYNMQFPIMVLGLN